MRKEITIINGKEYNVYIILEQRNDTRASIGRIGIYIRIPVRMSREEQFKEIVRLKRWAMEKIKEKKPEFKQKGSRNYTDGEKLLIANEEYSLHLS